MTFQGKIGLAPRAPASIELRDYQSGAIEALYAFFAAGGQHPIVVVPTGGGKSIIIAEFTRRAISEWPETRILILAHVKELLQQNLAELIELWPDAPAGLYSAGLGRKDIRAQIVFGSIQSIYSKAYDLQQVDLVLIDECHLLSPNGNSMYRKLLSDLTVINPHMRVIGFSATPFRLDSGSLTSGKDALFTDVAYEVPVLDLVNRGYLSPLVSKNTATRLDVSGVAVRGGEFVPGQLEAAVDQDPITQAAVDEIMAYGQERHAWLAFCSGVKHALHVRDAIRARGISCETVSGETPGGERDAILAAYKRGQIRCVTNANVLTTGFNHRAIDLIAFLRPTKSASLYVQMAGRGMRLSPETGKTDCLVLDFARVVATHGPVDLVKVRDRVKGEGPAPVKECPACKEDVYASARTCPCCGYEFQIDDSPKIEAVADKLPVMSNEPVAPEWIKVTDVSYRKHEKVGKPDSIRVDYECGFQWHREWICPDHQGFARRKFERWWRQRVPGSQPPASTEDALARINLLRKPSEISVRPAGKYSEIVNYRFAAPEPDDCPF